MLTWKFGMFTGNIARSRLLNVAQKIQKMCSVWWKILFAPARYISLSLNLALTFAYRPTKYMQSREASFFGRPFVKWFALCYWTIVCPVCLSVTLVYWGQTVRWIKMKLGMEVGLGPGNIVSDGDPTHLTRGSAPPLFGPCLLFSSNTSSVCPGNMVNLGPLAAEIGLPVLGTPANFNGFRILAALLHGI